MNNSRKILNKIFKTGLVTASSLTLLMGSGAFAASMRSAKERGSARNRAGYREINLEMGKGLTGQRNDMPFIFGSTLQLNNREAKINTGKQENNICALDLHGQNATLNVKGNIKLGSVVNTTEGDKKLQVTINDEQALTLTGTGTTEALKFEDGSKADPNSYDALDKVTLKGNTAKLEINSADREGITFETSINGENNKNGTLIINTPAVFTKSIGNKGSLDKINIIGTTVRFNGTEIKAESVVFASDNSSLYLNNKQGVVLTGDIRFDGYDAKLYVADNILIKGNLKNYSEKVVGEINFRSSGVVQGNIGQRNIDRGEALKDINIQGGDTKVELQGDVTTKNLSFVPADKHNAASTVQIGGDLIAENVIFANGNAQGGILEFNGQNKDGYTFSGKIENGGNATLKVNTYKLTANDVTIGDIKTIDIKGNNTLIIDANLADVNLLDNGNKINFEGEDSTLILTNSSINDDMTITLANTLDTGNNNFGQVVINSVEAGKTLTIASADNITLGTEDHKLKKLIFIGAGSIDIYPDIFATNIKVGNAVTLADGRNITGDVLGDANSSIEFLGDGEINGKIIDLKMLKVGKGNVLLQAEGDYMINEIQGTGTKTLTLPENFNLTGAINSTGGEPLKLNFTNGGSISGVVGTAANPVGDITTNGVTSFGSTINSNGNITLSKGSITAMNVIADDAVIMATDDLAFNSDLTGSGTTISLGTSQITYTGQANFSDQLTILANYDVETQDCGNILITAGSKIDLSQVTDLQINFIAPAIDITQIDENTKYRLISSEDGNGLVVLPIDRINFTMNGEQNRFVKWSIDESSLTVSAADTSKEVLKKEAKEIHDPIVKEAIEALLSDNNNDKDLVEKHQYSPAVGGVVNQLGRIDKDKTPEIIKPLIQNKINPSTVVRIHTKVNNIVNATLNTRMNNFVAEAAGDETETKLGVWVSPFIGNSEQKIKGDVNDYKAKSRGATVGFDGFVTDDLLLGTSYTRAYTIMKHKNDKLGDESRVKSDIYSVYGLYDVPNSNLFFSGIALYSNSLVKNYSQRPVILAGGVMSYQTAIGKHRSHSYTGQILAGYDYLSSQAVNLKPMIGIRYSKSKDAGYLETGTSFQNLTVKGATSDLVEGIVGFRASKNINTGHMILTPELYSFVHRHFKDKSQLVDARLPGMTNPFPNSKINQAKISFNVGGGLTAKYKMMEYGINYNVNIANKYLAQQGSLKIRVNF